jgi:ATP-binding cassette, subfamily C (CFTR/MRP), member 1
MSYYVSLTLKNKQKAWNDATQRRLAKTSAMLSSMKSIKMLGMADSIESKIRDLRNQEIEVSEKLRWMMVAYNASGKLFVLQPREILTVRSECPWHSVANDYFSAIRSNL